MRKRQPGALLQKSLTAIVELVFQLVTKTTPAISDVKDIIESIPQTLANEFTSMIFSTFEDRGLPVPEWTHCFIHPSVKTLDMSSWRAKTQQQVCPVLPQLQHLRKLSLSIRIGSLWFSTSLVSFTYPEYCTDTIIQDLAKYSRSLQVLSIPLASGVTDNCICFLLQLQQLQDLNVSATSLTDKGLITLMFGLEKLRRWQGGNILDRLFEETSENMQDYTSFKVTGLIPLANYFPNLTHIALSTVDEASDLAALHSLETLQHINMRYAHAYDSGMRQFLDLRGKKLLTLCVQEVLQMDITHIAASCPHLKTLQLEDCFISVGSMGAKRHLPHFQSVERLEVIVFNEEWADLGFQFPFFDYSNLNHLLVINVPDIDNNSLTRAVVEREWLKELRTLELRGLLGYLSTKTFMLLLKHCPHLEYISDLAAWKGVPPFDLDVLMRISKQKNLDIKILCFPDVGD